MDASIVVHHQQGAEWALVIVVTRSMYGRRTVTPMIFCCADCGIFATAPQLRNWQRGGLVCVYSVAPERREEMLSNAVQEFCRQVGQRSFIRERTKVGIVAQAKARSKKYDEPLEFFGLNREQEPAFFWLLEKDSTAYQALRVAKFLAEKYRIGELTQTEREALATKLLTNGETLKSPNAILNHWQQNRG
jgi:hypothetical protein